MNNNHKMLKLGGFLIGKKLENKKILTEELEKEIDKILKANKIKRELCELPLSDMAHLNNQKL